MIKERLREMGLTPAKAVLIAVLGLIFAVVVLQNFMGGETTPSAEAKPRKRRLPITPVVSPAPGNAAEAMVLSSAQNSVRKWPEIELAQAIEHDPFALPVPLRPKKKSPEQVLAEQGPDPQIEIEKEQEKRLAELRERRREKLARIKAMQQSGVAIALVTQDERVIKIGNKKFYEGDLWEGFRIVEIRSDGSVVVDMD